MSRLARFYIYSVVLLGFTAFAAATEGWATANPARFAMYFVITILCSGLKVTLPNVTGTMSVYFLFTLIGVVQLTLAETMILGCSATLVQTFWRAEKRPKPVHIMFNTASITLVTWAAYGVYHTMLRPSFGLSLPLALGAAAIVFFVANTGLVALVIALTENKSVTVVWKDSYFWCFPYYIAGASIAGVFDVVTTTFGWEMALLTVPLVVMVFRTYKLYLGKLKFEKDHAQNVAALHLRTIEALALAIEAKDTTTHKHLERVKVYALAIGDELKITALERQALEAAALLHDIGKLAVPEHIISKPGKLTPEEFEKMKIHPVVGAEILTRVDFPYPVAPIVLAHHEKWDGTGYPYGLKGDEIPIGARILSAVDCLDALASDRQYRRALPLDEAMGVVEGLSGVAYDPRVVEVLKRRYVELEKEATTSAAANVFKLSTDIKIERGEAPGAGFAEAPGPVTVRPSIHFLTSIAAARQEAQELFELAKDLGTSLSLGDTLLVISARVKRLVPFDALCIALVRDVRLKPEFAIGEHAAILQSLDVAVGQGLSGWVAGNRQPILNGSPMLEPGYALASGNSSRLNSALSVPLEGMENVVGVLTLYSSLTAGFSRDQLRVLLAISTKVAASIENAMKYEQAKTAATVDFLTQLPNARSLFLHLDGEVERCSREGTSLAVLVFDLDGFKLLNDRYGHLKGNEVLKLVASSLKQGCRIYDYVARMGGDEFVIVMPGIDEAVLAERIRTLELEASVAGHRICNEYVLSLSVGSATLGPDAQDAEGLLAAADRRMYRRKQSRKPARQPRPQPAPPEAPAAPQLVA